MSMVHSIELLRSGQMFDFDDPTPDMVQVSDIAAALGNTCRFGGHVKKFYSVAEHAITVARCLQNCEQPAELVYAALHHDSHEAYLGDIPSPLKHKLGQAWKDEFVAPVDAAVTAALGIDPEMLHHPSIKYWDRIVLGWEAAILKPSGAAQIQNDSWTQMKPSDVPSWAVRCLLPEDAGIDFLEADFLLQP